MKKMTNEIDEYCSHCGVKRINSNLTICHSCKRMYPSNDTKECPKCCYLIPQKAIICSYCKSSLQKINEMTYVGVVIIINYLLLKVTAILSSHFYYYTNKYFFIVFSYLLLFFSYVFSGILLGVTIPINRNKTIMFYVIGITIINEFFWPSNLSFFLNVIAFVATLIWVFALIKLGMLFGNRAGKILNYQVIPEDNWDNYVKTILLVIGASILKAIAVDLS